MRTNAPGDNGDAGMINHSEAHGGEVLLYEAPDGEVRVDVRLDHETVWLTQEQMSQLFARERSVITKHVRNVFREGELDPEATCAKFAQVQTEGERTVTREVDHYNLDVIISVGYRVKSSQGTCFRRIRFTITRNCARTLSRTVQSIVTFLRTDSTSSRAIVLRVGSPKTFIALSLTSSAS
jgi:hypothetical protein